MLSIHLFTPAIPSIAVFFKINAASAQLTVTIFLVGVSLGQLIYGPISNRYGRKLTLYIGIFIEIIGALLCAFSQPLNSFYLLIISRFIMALGGAVGLTLTLNIISDYYNPENARRIIAYATLAFSIMPALSVAIGGVLVTYWRWDTTFYFLALYGVFIFILSVFLPETAPLTEVRPIKLKGLVKAYAKVFRERYLLSYALIAGGTTAIVYIFAVRAPFIVIHLWKIAPDKFGALNMIPPVGMFIGYVIAAKLVKLMKATSVIIMGETVMLGCSLAMFILFIFEISNVWSLFLLMAAVFFGLALVYSNVLALATACSDDKAHASSGISFINMSVATFGVLLMSAFKIENAYIMPLIFTAISLIIIIIFISKR